jgi:Collagen triple helix repeat (20 copies)
MLTKGVVLVVAAGVLLSVGGSWGVVALSADHSSTKPTSAATGAPGLDGSAGKNGTDGKDGSNGTAGLNGYGGQPGARGVAGTQGASGADGTQGATGATGATGVPGAIGATGAIGAPGAVGPTGASGASAPTFSAISPAGIVLLDGVGSTFSTQTAAVPAGPALVGFSVGLQIFGPDFPATCSLVDANDPTIVFATTASSDLGIPPDYSTYAATQVVNLTAPTALMVQCTMTPFTGDPAQYQSLSVYAISFAP